MKNQLHIGTGRLTWDATERRSDRYGAIYLMVSGDSLTSGPIQYSALNLPPDWIGKTVRLEAKVIECRESTHIGDLFHGVFPRTPKVDTVIHLGVGTLQRGLNHDHQPTVVLMPEDSEHYPWMRLRGLYDAHEQTVELIAKEVRHA